MLQHKLVIKSVKYFSKTELRDKVVKLEREVDELKVKYDQQLLRLSSIKHDDSKIFFHTGFSSYLRP